MRRLFYCFALMISIGANAQGRLLLSAAITDLPNDSVVYLWGANGHDLDSTYVHDHGFKFERDLKQGGDVYIISVGQAPNQSHGIPLYLGPGKVDIKGAGPYFANASITGNSFIGEWQELVHIMYDSTVFHVPADELNKEIFYAQALGDKDKYKELMDLSAEYGEKRLELGRNWMANHPNSPLCAYVLSVFISPVLPIGESRIYFEKLSPEAKNTAIAVAMAARYNDDRSTAVGQPAPLFTQPDTLGRQVSLSDFRGKYVLVDFWASWCKPCRAANPSLRALYEKYKDKNFTIISVSMDTDKEKWLNAIHTDQLPWTQVSDLGGSNCKAATLYHILSIPASFLVDPQGKIAGYGFDEQMLANKLNNP